jgi:hypothetical protein
MTSELLVGVLTMRPRIRAARSVSAISLAAAIAWLAAGCASVPPVDDMAVLDEKELRSCLGPAIPIELIRDPSRVKGSVLLELYVHPSGRIYYASIVSGSGNTALDDYLAWRLASLQCAPFMSSDSNEPYSVELEVSVESND